MVQEAHIAPLVQGVIVISDNETEEDDPEVARVSPSGSPDAPSEDGAPDEPKAGRGMAEVPALVRDAVARCARWIDKQLAARKLPLQGAKFSSKSAVCPLCLLTFDVGTVMVLTYLGDGSPKPIWVHHHCVREILEERARC